MATLSLEQVTKVFANGVEAVRQLDLFVDEGEFVVLVGPSGCGKTTALRMVAGLEDVTSGTIRLERQGRQRPLGQGTGRGDGLPELRPLPAHERARQHRVLAQGARRDEAGAPAEGARDGRRPRALGGGAPKAAPALGRSAPARGHGAGARARAGRLPHGRAALEPRRQPARPDAQRGAAQSSAGSASRRSTSPTTRPRR